MGLLPDGLPAGLSAPSGLPAGLPGASKPQLPAGLSAPARSVGEPLLGLGAVEPDFDVRHLKQTVDQLEETAGRAKQAAQHAEASALDAGRGFEQMARYAEHVADLPVESFQGLERPGRLKFYSFGPAALLLIPPEPLRKSVGARFL
eukprot:gnl/TRDRNA2_/TRDRNA2_191888_c0_seq1.p2 gnl/TRDRNA2_/TRDRNA2_191888_c0~~gnl/TRDRNA2_/TRDRNA2_191888_c0_seq1.p2  ORF type:complete len:147 (+),score=26.16 gnl/TRDRNA2_/TRDRNA2_191888_c0_seq1:118-558(+)